MTKFKIRCRRGTIIGFANEKSDKFKIRIKKMPSGMSMEEAVSCVSKSLDVRQKLKFVDMFDGFKTGFKDAVDYCVHTVNDAFHNLSDYT